MTDPMDDLRQASADVSGVEVLSSAAQAIWDAAWQLGPVNCESHEDRRRQQIAAVLRVAAHEVAPFPGRYPMNEYMEGFRDAKQSVHHQLQAIANELEGVS